MTNKLRMLFMTIMAAACFLVNGSGQGTESIATSMSKAKSTTCPGAKLIFVVYCRADITHKECMARWDGHQHVGLVKKIPQLVKHVHNETVELPFAGAVDGIGELWFPSVEAMNAALNSPEFAAAVEDAQRFLDFSKTYAVVVNEIAVIGPCPSFGPSRPETEDQ